ncbi:MAG: protein phosphatase 2C domain-containing protein [Candidatus Uhrbacteria bacterium]
MTGVFEIAGGSVAGRDHVAAGRNNQDAFAWYQDDQCAIAVVCDGCGESLQSELGARLIADMVVRSLRKCLREPVIRSGNLHMLENIVRSPPVLPEEYDLVLRLTRDDVRNALHYVARAIGTKQFERFPMSFLATVVGVCMTRDGTVVFSCGDGVYAANGRIATIGPYPDNAPPYLAYGMLGEFPDYRSAVTIHAALGTDEVQSILLGTDGVSDLIAAADRTLPGKDEFVGPLAQFWTDDRYFRNPDMIRRRLTIINRDAARVEDGALVREPGLLRDDTTIVVIRRITK